MSDRDRTAGTAKPVFVDNRDGNTLAWAITTHLAALRREGQSPAELCVASCYFNRGWQRRARTNGSNGSATPEATPEVRCKPGSSRHKYRLTAKGDRTSMNGIRGFPWRQGSRCRRRRAAVSLPLSLNASPPSM